MNESDKVSGEFVICGLFTSFVEQVDRKLDAIKRDHLSEQQILKSFQRGEDHQFDHLLSSLGCISQYCLPSLVEALFKWYYQHLPRQPRVSNVDSTSSVKDKSEKQKQTNVHDETKEVSINVAFSLVLIEILRQLPTYPLPDQQLDRILHLIFAYFKQAIGPKEATKARIIADLYSEVLGVIAKTKFQTIHHKFLHELEDAKRSSEHGNEKVLGLIMGMKFFRVKMYPVEDFEACFRFLRVLADFSLEVKDREIKHGLASLFVEILIPVAAAVKTEVNVPVLRDFVDALYPTSLELSKRKKNLLALYPLVTCLLCVSQKQFFLNNWHIFLDNCLSNLKHRDQKVCRVSLESLYRLIWTYTVRIKCESNTATQSRLLSIIRGLFPVGSRNVVPKDTPLSIYVKIIQFIAQERLDFAMKEIILELLCITSTITRNPKITALHPERMNIGLRAFLVVTDSLQQKEGAPPMPSTIGVMPSGNTLRVKKTYLNKLLTDDDARTIGVLQYHKPVQKALDYILQTLDSQVGQKMMMTNAHVSNKTFDLGGIEIKPKIELFRTCIAAMPRLLPVGTLTFPSIFELLSRLTIHIDEEVRSLAFNSLHLFCLDFNDNREDLIATFVSFILNKVTDIHPILLDTSIKHLIQLTTGWKNKVVGTSPDVSYNKNTYSPFIARIEGFALVLFCSCRSVTRKLAILLLKEIKSLAQALNPSKDRDELCVDALDRFTPDVVHEVIQQHRDLISASNADYNTLKLCSLKNDVSMLIEESSTWHQNGCEDLWSCVISSYLHPHRIPSLCGGAMEHAWLDVCMRFTQVGSNIEAANNTSNKKSSVSTNSIDSNLPLWYNYVVFICRSAPANITIMKKQASNAILAGTPDWMVALLKDVERQKATPSFVFQRLISLLKVENNNALRDSAVVGLGSTSITSFNDLIHELLPVIHDATKPHRQENIRRKRKRDVVRLMLVRIFQRLAKAEVLSEAIVRTFNETSKEKSFVQIFLDYIKDTCVFLESVEKLDSSHVVGNQNPSFPNFPPGGATPNPQNTPSHSRSLDELRRYFGSMITLVIKHLPSEIQTTFLPSELRRSLFFLFGRLCSKYEGDGSALDRLDALDDKTSDPNTLLHLTALKAECSVLCCAPVFDRGGLDIDKGAYIFHWLEALLDCVNPGVHGIGREAVVMLLHHNSDIPSLIEWLVGKCFTGSKLVAQGCFLGVAAGFNFTAYPYNNVVMMNLSLFFLADGDVTKQAQCLLKRVEERISSKITPVSPPPPNPPTNNNTLQYLCSQRLSTKYPQLTTALLSEIFSRFLTSNDIGQRRMLQYLIPWLHNIHLHLSEGVEVRWAAHKTTTFILCNFTYISIQFHEIFSSEIDSNWSTLSQINRNNLQVIVLYCCSLLSLRATEVLSRTAMNIMTCIARANPKEVVEYLVSECQVAEPPIVQLIPGSDSPYFNITVKQSKEASPMKVRGSPKRGESFNCLVDNGDNVVVMNKQSKSFQQLPTTDTRIFTKSANTSRHLSLRHLPKHEPLLHHKDDVTTRKNKVPMVEIHPHQNRKSLSVFSLPTMRTEVEGFNFRHSLHEVKQRSMKGIGRSLPNQTRISEHEVVVNNLHDDGLLRCNIACIFLSELVELQQLTMDWEEYTDKIILAVLLGVDQNNLEEISKSSSKLLLNLMIRLFNVQVNQEAKIFSSSLLNCPRVQVVDGSSPFFFTSFWKKRSESISFIHPRNEDDKPIVVPDETPTSRNNLNVDSNFVLNFLKSLTLWPNNEFWLNEDVSPKCTTLRSTEQLTAFVEKVKNIFKFMLPKKNFVEGLGRECLKFATESHHVHYVNRALQIFRALGSPMPTNCVYKLLCCLLDCVADGGSSELQSKSIEILLTLLHVCENIPTNISNHTRRQVNRPNKMFPKPMKSPPELRPAHVKTHHHKRSGSVTLSKKLIEEVKVDTLVRIQIKDHESDGSMTSQSELSHHTSETITEDSNKDEQKKLIVQIFFITIGLLESDHEHEHTMAIKILEKCLERIDILNEDKALVERYFSQIEWPGYMGLQSYLIKSLTLSSTFHLAFSILSDLTIAIHSPIVSQQDGGGFPRSIIALLPYLALNFNDPDVACCECAQNIAQICVEYYKSKVKLQSLAHVMSLYANKTYNKTPQTWVSVVCKYTADTFPDFIIHQLLILTEILGKGPQSMNGPCLQVLFNLLSLSSVLSNEEHTTIINSVLCVVYEHLHGKDWNEALNILKLAVSRSSHLVLPATMSPHKVIGTTSTQYELPGLTLSFDFDLNNLKKNEKERNVGKIFSMNVYDYRTIEPMVSSWHHPTPSQANTRELVRSIINACFSSKLTAANDKTNEIAKNEDMLKPLNHATESTNHSQPEKMNSSREDVSVVDDPSFGGVLRDFDFLNELEVEGESSDTFNTGLHWNRANNVTTTSDGGNQFEEPPEEYDLTSVVYHENHEDEYVGSASSSMSSVATVSERHDEESTTMLFMPPASPFKQSEDYDVDSKSSSLDSLLIENIEDFPHEDETKVVEKDLSSNSSRWLKYLNTLATDCPGDKISQVFLIFLPLYQELCYEFNVLSKSSCKNLGSKLANIAAHFNILYIIIDVSFALTSGYFYITSPRIFPLTHPPPRSMLDELPKQLEPPLCCATTSTLAPVVEQLKLEIFEINKIIEFYREKVFDAYSCLDKVNQLKEEETNLVDLECQQLNLCQLLYKLHFQLLLIFQSFCKLIRIVTTSSPENKDMSHNISEIYEELKYDVYVEDEGPEVEAEMRSMTLDEASLCLETTLVEKNFHLANVQLNVLRHLWPDHPFGFPEDSKTNYLTLRYLQLTMDDKCYAVLGRNDIVQSTSVCNKLMEVNLQIQSSLKLLDGEPNDEDGRRNKHTSF
ncbi:protein furry homolog-like [Ciona intestinalis]